MIPASSVAALGRISEDFLPHVCVIHNTINAMSSGGVTKKTPMIRGTTRVRATAIPRGETTAPIEGAVNRWTVVFPAKFDVYNDDVLFVTVDGIVRELHVKEIHAPKPLEVMRLLLCIESPTSVPRGSEQQMLMTLELSPTEILLND